MALNHRDPARAVEFLEPRYCSLQISPPDAPFEGARSPPLPAQAPDQDPVFEDRELHQGHLVGNPAEDLRQREGLRLGREELVAFARAPGPERGRAAGEDAGAGPVRVGERAIGIAARL